MVIKVCQPCQSLGENWKSVDTRTQFGLNQMPAVRREVGRVKEMINYCPGGSMSSFTSCILNYLSLLPHGLKSRATPKWGSVAEICVLGGAGKRWTAG